MKKYIIILIFALLIFLTHYSFSGIAVWGDGIDYWAYLPSLYFDHDINFENEFKHIYTHKNDNQNNPEKSPEIQKTQYTKLGKVDNPHPPGTAIVWLPAFLIADFFNFIYKLPRNGFADTYQIFCGLWSVGLTIFGLVINERIVFRFIKNKKLSFLTTLAIFMSTPLLYYGSYDVLNSHFASFFLVSLFWYVLFIKYKNWKHAIIIGIITGFITLVRLEDGVLLLIALLFIYWKEKKLLNLNIILMVISFVTIVLPLIFIWIYLYGKPLPVYYISFWVFQFINFGSLFHITNGLFTRTPLILISLLGIRTFSKRKRSEFLLMFIFLFIQFIIITIYGGWSAAAYGGRMYISSLPFFAVCLSYVFDYVMKRWNYRYVIYMTAFFAILNCISILSFVFFEKQVNSGVKRGLEPATQERVDKIYNDVVKSIPFFKL